ncbi:AFR720Wp [Eremothecium gossypii ATCC 10895]|uniref:ER membrane protein complex subunit 1 n=1 Tax=Eremothecium gossypii (strain ATCC 10895 / CBS 109.51 / FGSC 9923 / NRRL Y-1056) TaxID=284811 RepID=Q751V5_EREGS|nr:AFR720Wp [Eremothecium gossypii ATCC 10895]AAS54092.1 AFR720Wp [Eremothecium gossypii ATCC 10895]AEY98407.1 FAFR720Wp [Eremothecium gossypii FDAG1]
MRICILQAFLCAALWRHAYAVFDDEAYKTDWQVVNVGDYRCVVDDGRGSLVVLSDLDHSSMLSWISCKDGKVEFRQKLEFQADDMMVLGGGGQVALRHAEGGLVSLFDTQHGFQLDNEVDLFRSSCTPELSSLELKTDVLKFHSARPEVGSAEIPVPKGFREIKYLSISDKGQISVLFACDKSVYHYTEARGGSLTTQWTRDESLANIVAYTYLSETEDSELVNNEWNIEESMSLVGGYLRRLCRNLERLKTFILTNRKTPGTLLTEFLKDDEQSILKSERRFGLAQKLLAATKHGDIVALNMRTGERDWTFPTGYEDIVLLSVSQKTQELHVFTKKGLSLILDISEINSPTPKPGELELPNQKVMRLGHSDNYYVKTAFGDPELIVLDSNSEVNDKVIVDHTAKSIFAFVIKDSMPRQIWTVDVGNDEEIVAFQGREETSISNVGIVLGNRTVLYKYLNPNLASYIVANKKEDTITVNIIDTITGTIIHRATHDEHVNLLHPINLVFGEHWVIYSYFSNKPIAEQRISVIEMYESPEPNTRYSNSSVIENSLTHTVSPHFVSQSFIFSDIIKSMLLSKTVFGITTKAILMELDNGQLTYLPKFILNARRVAESQMSADDRKEFMAVPYVGTIPVHDNFVLTHYRDIITSKESKLFSIPTNLESTTFVCSLSHDLFCNRVAPSGQFDILSPTFEKVKLCATIVALIVMCYILGPIVGLKQIRSNWLVKEFSI